MKLCFKTLVLSASLIGGGVATAADTYKIDPVHSFVTFMVTHLGVGHAYGRFNEVEGTAFFDDDKPENSKLEIVVKAESVDTHEAKRDTHLKSPDFLNVKQ